MEYIYFDESKIFDASKTSLVVQYKEKKIIKYIDLISKKEVKNPDAFVKEDYFTRASYYKNYENKYLIGLEYEINATHNILNESWKLIGAILIDKQKKCYLKVNEMISSYLKNNLKQEDRYILDLPKINENNENLYVCLSNSFLWLGFHFSYHSILNMDDNNFEFNKNLQEEASSFFGNNLLRIGNDKLYPFGQAKVFKKWMQQEEIRPSNGKIQNDINKYIELPLKNITKPKLKKQTYIDKNVLHKYATIQKVSNNISVIRIFKDVNYLEKLETIELFRMYVEKNKITLCKQNNFSEYVPVKGNITSINFDYQLIKNKKDDFSGTIFEYLMKHFDEFNKEKHFLVLFLFIKYPILEKLYNAGFEDLIKILINNDDDINYEIKRIFGKINNKKSLNMSLGINKKQMLKLKEKEDFLYFSNIEDYDYRRRYVPGLLYLMKIISGQDMLNTLDEQSYDELLDIAVDIQKYYKLQNNSKEISNVYQLINWSSLIRDMYNVKTYIIVLKSFLVILQENTIETSNYYVQTYRDYLYMIKQMGTNDGFKATFSEAAEITEMHNIAVELFNTIRNKYLKDEFIKVSKRWEKYKFKNKRFSIVIPNEPEDLAKEGLELRHCVKGYIEKVIKKHTNIVFIRKNDELDKSFFTVEISNDNTIEQVHGFCNRNVDTEPELLDFIVEWSENNNLKLSNFDKVR